MKKYGVEFRRKWMEAVKQFSFLFGIKEETANATLMVAIVPCLSVVSRMFRYVYNSWWYGNIFNIPVEYIADGGSFISDALVGIFLFAIVLYMLYACKHHYKHFFHTKENCHSIAKRYCHNFVLWTVIAIAEIMVLMVICDIIQIITQVKHLNSMVVSIFFAYELTWPAVGWLMYNYEEADRLADEDYFKIKYANTLYRIGHILATVGVAWIYVICDWRCGLKGGVEGLVGTLIYSFLTLIYVKRFDYLVRIKKEIDRRERIVSVFIDRISSCYFIVFAACILLSAIPFTTFGYFTTPQSRSYRITPDHKNAIIYSSEECNILEEIDVDLANSKITIYTDKQTVVGLPIEYEIMEFGTATIRSHLSAQE